MSRLGRRIAFDYGDVRIGVAVCDPDGILATPLITLQRKDPKVFDAIEGICQEYSPVKIYVGFPVQLSGESGIAVEKVEKFVDTLREKFSIPIDLIDERMSTVSATKRLRSAGISEKDSRSTIDQMAAVEILEQGLARDR
jgi:putative Holliday junction resolvase